MTWEKGKSGNPSGRPAEQQITTLIRRACVQEDWKRVRRGVEKVLDAVAAGEQWAINFVADRMDGKPHQSATIVHQREVKDLTTHELLTALASERIASEEAIPGESVEVH